MSKISDNPMVLVPGPLPEKPGAQMGPERRRAARYPFTAAADVTELGSQTRVAGRSSDLAEGGCFIDVLSPFPVGSLVRVRLERNQNVFEATAKVTYAQQSLGMGLAFTEVKPEHQVVLRAWIAELSGEPLREPVVASPEPDAVPPESNAEDLSSVFHVQQVLSELINLMVRKKVINEGEGTALLRKIFR